MFRVIHPNRWFFWTIAFLVIVGSGLTFLIKKEGEDFVREMTELGVVGSATWRTYHSPAGDFILRYPQTWQVEIDRFDSHTVTLENPQNFSENITVAVTKPINEKLIRESLVTNGEKKVVIDGQPGAWLYGSDKSDKVTANAILVAKAGKLYFISGSARQFERIAWSFRFEK